jgi:hypothetical protein
MNWIADAPLGSGQLLFEQFGVVGAHLGIDLVSHANGIGNTADDARRLVPFLFPRQADSGNHSSGNDNGISGAVRRHFGFSHSLSLGEYKANMNHF